MNLAVPKETAGGETRVAVTPETVKKLVGAGLVVSVECGAGANATISDTVYEASGARTAKDAQAILSSADIVLKVQRPDQKELSYIKEGACLIALLQPFIHTDLVRMLAERKITALSMDTIPRIARAQKLDALSSQSNVAGYKSVLMAANHLGKMMPMMITAAGTVSPAKVLVIGAGVAGLQAIATAKRLGAVVEAFDTRPVVRDQVESLGAKFLALEVKSDAEDQGGYAKELSKEDHDREMAMLAEHAAASDIVITTAQIPGKKAPLLIVEDTVKKMHSGSVIVDLAAEGGGNCALTEAGRTIEKYGVTIVGERNIPGLMPAQSSQLYARNIMGLLLEILKDGKINLDPENEVVKGALITHAGKIVHQGVHKAVEENIGA